MPLALVLFALRGVFITQRAGRMAATTISDTQTHTHKWAGGRDEWSEGESVLPRFQLKQLESAINSVNLTAASGAYV